MDTQTLVNQDIEFVMDLPMLRRLRNYLAVAVDEFKITFKGPEGFSIAVVDPAHVCMVGVDYSYPIDGSGEYLFDSDHLVDAFKGVESSSNVIIKVKAKAKDAEDGEVEFVLGNEHVTERLLDCKNIYAPKFPNVKFPTKVEVRAVDLARAIQLGSIVTDHVEMKVDGGVFTVRAQGDRRSTLATVKAKLMRGGEARSLFSCCDYLTNILKAVPGETMLEVELGNDIPLRISFMDGLLNVVFLLAPRIEDGHK